MAPSGTTTLSTLAQELGVRARRIDAPAIVESSETCAAILRESSVRMALELASTVDTTWTGIGGVGKARGVLAALRSEVVDIAVVDAELAAEVLRRHNAGTRSARPS